MADDNGELDDAIHRRCRSTNNRKKNCVVSSYRLIPVPESSGEKENSKFHLEIQNGLCGTVIIQPGDFVMIAGPTEKQNYFARVLSFYENHFANELNASIRWFYSIDEIPKRLRPDGVHPNELFLTAKETADSIDVETIKEKCTISWLSQDADMQKVRTNELFYRKSFNGKSFSDILHPNVDNSKKSLVEQRHVVNTPKRVRQTPSRYISFERESFLNGKAKSARGSTRGLRSSKGVNKGVTKDSASLKAPNISKTASKNSQLKSPLSKAKVDFQTMTSPISASGFGKLGASAVVLDIWNDDDDDDDSGDDAMTVSGASSKLSGKSMKKSALSKRAGKKNRNDVKPEVSETEENTCIDFDKTGSEISENAKGLGKRKIFISARKEIVKQAKTTKLKTNEEPSSHIRSSSRMRSIAKATLIDPDSDIDSNSGSDSSFEVESLESSSDESCQEETADQKSLLRGRSKSSKLLPTLASCDNNSDLESDKSRQGKTPNSKVTKQVQNSRKTKKTVSPVVIKTPRGKLPFIPARPTPVRSAKGNLEKSRERLHVSSVPECLPCRENEFQEVCTFVEGKLRSGGGGCIYVSGVPGTGKTATVREVLNCLRQAADEGDLPEFTYVDINGMRLTEPRQAYVQLLLQLTNRKATPDHAADLLTKLFSQRRKMSTVVLADELDLLWTRKQDVLYHLFDWPTHRHAKLIVVAIANTMDLPERILMNRVSSRLGLTRLTFRPYSFKQLQEIVASRLDGLETFESDAVQLVSRKVAAVSGDARRCLDICRRATEIAEVKKRKVVGIEQVHTALQEMFATPMVQSMRACSRHEQLFLHATVAEFRRSGMEEATLARIIKQHSAISQLEGAAPVTVSTLVKISQRLATNRLILLEGGNKDLFSRIRLNVSVDDVLFSLKQ